MRVLLLAGGALVAAALWLGPLPALSRTSFTAHMGLHMALVAVVAPLLALAVAGGRADPARARPRLFSPVPVAMLELAAVWAWHAPALHRAARGSAAGFAAEQTTFLLCGLLLWVSAFGGPPQDARERAGPGVAALLLTSMHMTLLGALIALAPRELYSHHGGSLEDQQLGGALMILIGGASYMAGGLALSARLLREPGREAA